MRPRPIASLVLVLACVLPAAAGVSYHVLVPFDVNNDQLLDKAELTTFFKSKGQADADAAANAVDVLTARCQANCHTVTIAAAAEILEQSELLKQESKPGPLPPCKYLSVKRTVKDTVHLRGGEAEFPAVFSYARNKHADDRDQLNILGALETVNCKWDVGTLANLTFGFASGFDFELDGSSKPEENTIAAAVPLSLEYIPRDPNAFITRVTVTLTPAFKTDRALDREVWDTTLALTWRSKPMLHAGLRTSFPSVGQERVAMWWQPVLRYELGNVRDAAGNEELAKIVGSYNRFAPGIDLRFWPTALSERLTLKASATHRRNVGNASRTYVEGAFLYDLTADGSISFTAIYRHGRKPPDFSAKDQWLIGFGFKR
jgi:hypothetical protein